SPAAKAGLQGGDVIVRMGDREIEDVYGYMYALQEHQPGDVVDVVVLREGQRITISVTLEGNEG
ncbi:MAG: PDZ domain-containing protein, partial [Gemmatimonadetes bacterium]|nr:PDZ domain-containing protein [Gemmatimonadota bacterium]